MPDSRRISNQFEICQVSTVALIALFSRSQEVAFCATGIQLQFKDWLWGEGKRDNPVSIEQKQLTTLLTNDTELSRTYTVTLNTRTFSKLSLP